MVSVLQHSNAPSSIRARFPEKPLMIHHYNYPFITNTTLIKMWVPLLKILFLVSLWLNKITKTSERIPDRLWACARIHLVNPTRGPAVLNSKNKFEGTDSILITSKTHELYNTSENNPYDYQLRIALSCSTKMHYIHDSYLVLQKCTTLMTRSIK